MRYVAVMCVVGAMTATAVQAQERAVVAKVLAEGEAVAGRLQSTRIAVEGRTTKGAPYSAEAVTESVQVLADGNRISSKNATRIFRDSEGRIRREQLNPAGTEVASITISDPVAGTTYVLDPAKREASRNAAFITIYDPAGTGVSRSTTTFYTAQTPEAGSVAVAGERIHTIDVRSEAKMKVEAETIARVGTGSSGVVVASRGPGEVSMVRYGVAGVQVDASNVTREELGQQNIEGVMATGTRTTTEIPAGSIGNERAIKIVSEQWFSPDLQVLVLTKHSDPRVGETTYRLSGVIRADPGPSLFELPSDYTVKESAIRRDQK